MAALTRIALLVPILAAASIGRAETLIEHSNEARFQLDVKVPAAALAAYLPPGWTSNVATQGPAKDCNLRVIFIDRVTINGPDGAPRQRGSHRLVFLAAPVKNPAGESVQLVIGGLTDDPDNVPGPFGNYLLATTHSMQRTSTESVGPIASGPILDSQDWNFAAAGGEHFELHVKYERGNANKRNTADTKYYSAKNPDFYEISRQEQVLDIMRNVTTNPPDHVQEFQFKAGGGSFSKLFPSNVPVLSWDNVLWLNREILLP